MDIERLQTILQKFPTLRVMAVGDIFLDENVFGAVNEVSLEAPIPVFEVHEKRHNPGACGNAACNAASLGAQVTMVGVVGADVNADIVRREFEARGVCADGLVADPARPTNTYGKLKASGHNAPLQEVLRTDTPRPPLISGDVEAGVIAQIERLAPQVDAILIGDQISSVISAGVLKAIVACAQKHKLVTVADSRARAGIFDGIDLIVPNDTEAALAAGLEDLSDAGVHAAGKYLLQHSKNVFVTRGPKGITIFAADGTVDDVPVGPVKAIVDVTGAGDTVAAACVLTLAAGGTLREAAVLANQAAGIAVQQQGVVTVSLAEVEESLSGTQGPTKLKKLEALKSAVKKMQRDGKKVVWTNGCFDIMHVGHITYLLQARAVGDVLVVGLNSDASVRAIKGEKRPIINEQDRATVLASLECVDYLVLFDDPSPIKIIETLQPDVYAKGGDYTVDTINQDERRLVEDYGGSIAIIPGSEGHSTSNIVGKIMAEAGK